MDSLDRFCTAKHSALRTAALDRGVTVTEHKGGAQVLRNGRRMVSFSSNDYLGLAHHPQVVRAATEALARFGAGATASRLVTGHYPILEELEAGLATFKGSDACLSFGSGYLTNLGVIPALVGREDLIVIDELAHACLWAGARLSGASIARCRHNDVDDARRLLSERRSNARHCLVLTEGVFSMDGDLAPVSRLSELCASHDAWLLIDDAHATGVLASGHGSRAAAGGPPVSLQVGTLSKALGSYGGFVCASHPVVDLLRSRARTFVYSTGLPPPAAAAALAALEVIRHEPERCARPVALARRFCAALGLPAPEAAIVPVLFGSASKALSAMAQLEDQGILAVAIRPPTVPADTARLRFAFSAAHTEAEVDRAASAVGRLLSSSHPQRSIA